MKIIFAVPMLAAAATLAASPVRAQTQDPETLARIAEGEVGELDTTSIRKYGDIQGRFDVRIKRKDGAPSPDGVTPRTVRFMANCKDGTMVVAAVGLFDPSGQLAKTMVAPPGAIDAYVPEKDTQEAKWLRTVCMF